MKDTKRFKLEGSWHSQMIELMRRTGYNPGWQAEVMTVSSVAPLKFASGTDGIELEPEDYIINPDLLPKTEAVKINGVSQTIEYPNEIKVGDQFLVLFDHDDVSENAYVIMKV